LGLISQEQSSKEFGTVYSFIDAHALKVDHGAKIPEEVPLIERFQSLGYYLPKAEFKRLQTDMDNFIKREKSGGQCFAPAPTLSL
jgi:hypothetical protein